MLVGLESMTGRYPSFVRVGGESLSDLSRVLYPVQPGKSLCLDSGSLLIGWPPIVQI